MIESIKSNHGEIIINNGHYLHAVFTTPVFRFKDDFEAILTDKQIEIRSASRAGYSDLGKNKQRIEKIRSLYQNKLNG